MLNLLPLEFMNLLEILLKSRFHNFLIQKGIANYANAKKKKELKVCSYCSAQQCDVFLHCTKDKNCFAEWHNAEYYREMKK